MMKPTHIILTALLLAPLGPLTPNTASSANTLRGRSQPDAVPLAPLFDARLTDTSITVGPDKAFYLTGSAVDDTPRRLRQPDRMLAFHG